MSIPNSQEPCIYYDGYLNSQAKANFKRVISQNNEKNTGRKIMKASKPLLAKMNKQYFPEAEQSQQSAVTARIRNNSNNSKRGLRPKLGSRSGSASQKSTKKQLCLQISKLTSQLQNKNKALMKVKSPEKIKQIQIVELYQVIHFFQGKIKHLEEQIKRYEQALERIGRQCDEKSKHKSQVQQMVKLFESMRTQNSEMNAKIEQRDFNIGNLKQKLHKQQMRINFLQSKQNFKKSNIDSANSQSSRSKVLSLEPSRFNSFAVSSSINLRQKQQNYGNLQSKINKIQASLNFLKKQNQQLHNQVEFKQSQIHQLNSQLIQYRQAAIYFKNIANQQAKQNKSKQSSYCKLEKKDSAKQKDSKNFSEISQRKTEKRPSFHKAAVSNEKNVKQQEYFGFNESQNQSSQISEIQKIPTKQSKISDSSYLTQKLKQPEKLKQSQFSEKSAPQSSSKIEKKSNKSVTIRQNSLIDQSSKNQIKQLSQLQNGKIEQHSLHIEQQESPQKLIEQKKKSLNKQIFKKLKYQLLTEEIEFQQFIRFLIDEELQSEVLQQSPYNLKAAEAQQFLEWIQQIVASCNQKQYQPFQIVSSIIPKFNTLTLRMQNNLKIQVANELMNRQDQFAELTAQGSQIRQSQIEGHFKQWGLNQQHIDTVCKSYYEETGQVQVASVNKVKGIIEKWAHK